MGSKVGIEIPRRESVMIADFPSTAGKWQFQDWDDVLYKCVERKVFRLSLDL